MGELLYTSINGMISVPQTRVLPSELLTKEWKFENGVHDWHTPLRFTPNIDRQWVRLDLGLQSWALDWSWVATRNLKPVGIQNSETHVDNFPGHSSGAGRPKSRAPKCSLREVDILGGGAHAKRCHHKFLCVCVAGIMTSDLEVTGREIETTESLIKSAKLRRES